MKRYSQNRNLLMLLLMVTVAAIASLAIFKQDGHSTSIASVSTTSFKKNNSRHSAPPVLSHVAAVRQTKVPIMRRTISAKTPDSGIIGVPQGKNGDVASDNLFTIDVPSLLPHSRVWLLYEVRGVETDGVSKSINDRPGYGGCLIRKSDQWQSACEELSPDWIHAGENRILFTVNGDYSYEVRKVRISYSEEEVPGHAVVLSQRPVVRNNRVYLHGFTKGNISRLMVNGDTLVVRDREFEALVPFHTGKLLLEGSVFGKKIQQSASVLQGADAHIMYPLVHVGETSRKSLHSGSADSLSLYAGSLKVPSSHRLGNRSVSITPLRQIDLPPLHLGMVNVTALDEGYRFLPHGVHFREESATVRLKYDRTKIPSGYTEDDIRTFYFDLESKTWKPLEHVRVDKEHACVESRTSHFTDMINGVIQAPESPQTDAFVPTMMNDIKAADPTSKINLITPPTANNRGTAGLQYVFEMPPARNGMTPSLGIQYSNEGGSGWLGEGWNLATQSITLDTRWGVPRYDLSKETETYLLSGTMLSTMSDEGKMGVAHRGEKMNRKAGRQFYTRQGGDFSRIIRQGNNPGNYYWEVIDKQGTKYTYGGEGAVLKDSFTDASGSRREVIAEWKLTRVEETHGDYIEYSYETVDEPVRGGLVAKAIYLKEVRAGNRGENAHTVVTFEGSRQKRMKTNNARFGFLTSSNRLLEKVTVSFMGKVLRSYVFTYADGAFNKDLLSKVVHKDDTDKEVSHQDFTYYDDVQSNKGYVPFKDHQEHWNTHNDGLDAGFVNKLGLISRRFSDRPTALGGMTGNSFSTSFYAGVGIADGSPWKGNTAGGSYSYSRDNTEGLSALVDLNGDGLPDKVYKEDGVVFYRPQLVGSDGGRRYGEVIRVRGITNFSRVESTTHSGGGKTVAGWMAFTVELGKDFTKTKTKTTEYFSDINGDGLVDLVSNGRVYFNHIEFDSSGNAVPTFTLSSADTPSPIIYDGSKLDTSVGEISPDEQQEIIENSPMQDMVRVWKAPKDGVISISGKVGIIVPDGDYDRAEYAHADGVRVSIQKGSTELWHSTLSKGEGILRDAIVSSLPVSKGDFVYFRLQSGTEETSNGAFDNVRWSPIITYSGEEEMLPDSLSTTVYKPREGEIYDINTTVIIPDVRSFKLLGRFVKPPTSDDIVLRITASNNEKDSLGENNPIFLRQEVYTRTFASSETFDGDLVHEVKNPDVLTHLKFEIFSTSNVEWHKIKWQPAVEVVDAKNTRTTITGYVHYNVYSKMVNQAKGYILEMAHHSLTVTPRLSDLPAQTSGTVTLTVKSADKLIGKKTYTIYNGILNGDTLVLGEVDTGKIWMDYSFAGNIEDGDILSEGLLSNGDTVRCGFYAQAANTGFGLLYRGWGGFVYNAADGRFRTPIDETSLKLPDSKDVQIDPRTMVFTPLGTDQTTFSKWTGQNANIYLTADEMGTGRLADQNVVLSNPLDNGIDVTDLSGDCLKGTGAMAVTQVATNKSTAILSGALDLTYSDASGKAKTEVTMMDMNGDSYPDILAGGTIQYTNTQGGLSG